MMASKEGFNRKWALQVLKLAREIQPAVLKFVQGTDSAIVLYGQPSYGRYRTLFGLAQYPGLSTLIPEKVFDLLREDTALPGSYLAQWEMQATCCEVGEEEVMDLFEAGGDSDDEENGGPQRRRRGDRTVAALQYKREARACERLGRVLREHVERAQRETAAAAATRGPSGASFPGGRGSVSSSSSSSSSTGDGGRSSAQKEAARQQGGGGGGGGGGEEEGKGERAGARAFLVEGLCGVPIEDEGDVAVTLRRGARRWMETEPTRNPGLLRRRRGRGGSDSDASSTVSDFTNHDERSEVTGLSSSLLSRWSTMAAMEKPKKNQTRHMIFTLNLKQKRAYQKGLQMGLYDSNLHIIMVTLPENDLTHVVPPDFLEQLKTKVQSTPKTARRSRMTSNSSARRRLGSSSSARGRLGSHTNPLATSRGRLGSHTNPLATARGRLGSHTKSPLSARRFFPRRAGREEDPAAPPSPILHPPEPSGGGSPSRVVLRPSLRPSLRPQSAAPHTTAKTPLVVAEGTRLRRKSHALTIPHFPAGSLQPTTGPDQGLDVISAQPNTKRQPASALSDNLQPRLRGHSLSASHQDSSPPPSLHQEPAPSNSKKQRPAPGRRSTIDGSAKSKARGLLRPQSGRPHGQRPQTSPHRRRPAKSAGSFRDSSKKNTRVPKSHARRGRQRSLSPGKTKAGSRAASPLRIKGGLGTPSIASYDDYRDGEANDEDGSGGENSCGPAPLLRLTGGGDGSADQAALPWGRKPEHGGDWANEQPSPSNIIPGGQASAALLNMSVSGGSQGRQKSGEQLFLGSLAKLDNNQPEDLDEYWELINNARREERKRELKERFMQKQQQEEAQEQAAPNNNRELHHFHQTCMAMAAIELRTKKLDQDVLHTKSSLPKPEFSLLTQLLKPMIGGGCYTCVVGFVSQKLNSLPEMIIMLKLLEIFTQLSNKTCRNEIVIPVTKIPHHMARVQDRLKRGEVIPFYKKAKPLRPDSTNSISENKTASSSKNSPFRAAAAAGSGRRGASYDEGSTAGPAPGTITQGNSIIEQQESMNTRGKRWSRRLILSNKKGSKDEQPPRPRTALSRPLETVTKKDQEVQMENQWRRGRNLSSANSVDIRALDLKPEDEKLVLRKMENIHVKKQIADQIKEGNTYQQLLKSEMERLNQKELAKEQHKSAHHLYKSAQILAQAGRDAGVRKFQPRIISDMLTKEREEDTNRRTESKYHANTNFGMGIDRSVAPDSGLPLMPDNKNVPGGGYINFLGGENAIHSSTPFSLLTARPGGGVGFSLLQEQKEENGAIVNNTHEQQGAHEKRAQHDLSDDDIENFSVSNSISSKLQLFSQTPSNFFAGMKKVMGRPRVQPF